MEKIVPESPVLVMLYGFPGAGKTYFARQFCDVVQAAHLEQDRIRYELFEQPRFTKQENFALSRIMDYMTAEFLNAGISVVYDLNAMRIGQRRALRETARRMKAQTLIVWFQIDPDTAYLRNAKRDRRKNDDRFAVGYDVEQFKQLAAYMQHPEPTEESIVISGKHTFASQMSGVIKKMSDMKIVKRSVAAGKMVRPDLVNIVPQPHHQQMDITPPNGGPDLPDINQRPSRRNIVLR